MKKAAAKDKRSTTADEDVQRYLSALDAKRMFIGESLNMGWRLALTVIIPIVGGVKLDQVFNQSPSFTLAGLMLAAFGACVVVMDTVKGVTEAQAEATELEAESFKEKRDSAE